MNDTLAWDVSGMRDNSEYIDIDPDIINEISHIQSTKEFLAEEARNKASIVKENGVFVTCIGTIGKIGILYEECAFNQQKTARKNC